MIKIPLSGIYFQLNSGHKHFFRIMRITYASLFAAAFCLHAGNSYSQKVTLQGENLSVKEYMTAIEKQTEYLFIYDEDVNVDKKMSIDMVGRPVKEVLDNFASQLGITYTQKGAYIVLSKTQPNTSHNASTTIAQQEKKITGVVTDATGTPVIGANVIEQGTANGTITDMDGKFTLTVSNNATIQVSYIGYNTMSIKVGKQTALVIKMEEDSKSLSEVVVVGYGVQKKATITGSVSALQGDNIKKSGSMNITNTFAGQVPGVIATNRTGEPDSDYSTLLVRGKGSLNNNSPLIVIDGVANREGLERLNPNDIESISVLKDASAAIYGAQAANGVILVTTKNGSQSKPTIEYTGTFSLSQHTRTPKLLNAYNWMVYDDEKNMHEGTTQLWTNIKDGYLDGTINRNKYGDTDWMKAMFRTFAPQTRHSASLSGGNESVKYYIAGDFSYQEPAYRNTVYDYKTYQFRANLEAKVTKELTIGFNASGLNENNNASPISSGTMFWEAFMAYPYLYDYYPNGLPGPGIAWGNNLAVLANGEDVGNNKTDNFNLNTKLHFNLNLDKVTKGLSVSGYAAFDRIDTRNKNFQNVWDTYTYSDATGEYIKQTTNANNNVINLSQSDKKYHTNTLHARIAYDRTFLEKHHVGAFVAYEQSKTEGDYFSAWRGYYLSDKLPYLNYGGDKEKTNSGYGYISARQNIFGRLNYDYKSRYMLEFTLRHDGSMNFSGGHRWGTFPGLSAGWRISEEAFMNNYSWVDDLKLRASWGKLGNDRVNQFQYLTTFSMVNGAILGDTPTMNNAFKEARIGNPSITWEKVDTKNIALEGRLWNGLLGFDVEYFFQNRKDILTPKNASIPNYTGLTLPDQNIGEVNNKGIEIMLTHNHKVNQVAYNLGFNLTFAKNKIVFFDEAANVPEWQKRTGYSIDSWLMYKTDGIYQTQEEIDNSPHFANARPGDIKYVDLDGDGKLTSNDKYRDYISNIPQIVFGVNMGLSWKGFDLNILWSGQARAKQMIIPYSFNTYQEFFDKRWISAELTPNAKYPRAFNKDNNMNTKYSDFWLKNASFIRLKNVELAYTVPSNLTRKFYVERLRFFLTGNNLFTIDHIGFQDPESSAVNAGQYYPQQRTYSVGLNVSF